MATNILEQLANYARFRVQEKKKLLSYEEMKERAEVMPKGYFSFEKALQGEELSFICECKKASPSKGLIAKEFPYLQIAKEYEKAGADCISVLTEPRWFLGKDQYLQEIAEIVSIPCIRKDFVVDPYMIYEAKILGASAVLLICSILTEKELARSLQICEDLGLSALVEAHDAEEIQMALRAGARMIGVNNRNLKDFTVDTKTTLQLRNLIPSDVIFVSESGISGEGDVAPLKEQGVNACLIGEYMMKQENKKEALAKLKGV